MPSIGALIKHYSKQISGLTAYFSLLRARTYSRGTSLDESNQHYNRFPRQNNPNPSQSDSEAWIQGIQLEQIRPTKVTVSNDPEAGLRLDGPGIHVQDEFQVYHESR